MKKCLICNQDTKKLMMAFVYHFRLIDFDMFKYFEGTKKGFGLWMAIKMISPILSIFDCLKARNKYLIVPQIDKTKEE